MKRFLPFIAALAFIAAWPATYLLINGHFLEAGNAIVIPGGSGATTTVPAAPTIGTATRGNAQASVTFTPNSNGGSTVLHYTLISSVGPTANVAGSPGVITGLTNGTAQTFTVTATNAIGTSSASAASNSVTPATVPGAPPSVTATGGNAQATVSFGATANGGSAITGYTVTGSPSGSATGASSPITVTGLTNGTAYTFTVTATNALGTGSAGGPSNSVTPSGGTVPTAPTLVTVFQASAPNTVVVRWKHPSNYLTLRSGGIPVQSYTVQIKNSGGTVVGTTTDYPFIVDQNTNPATSFVGTLTNGSNVITGITTRNTGLTTGQAVIDRFGCIPSGTTVSSFTTTPSGGTYTVTLSANATCTDTYQRIGFNQSGKAAVWSQLNAKGTVPNLPTSGAPFTAVVTGNNVNGAGASGSSGNSVTPVTTSSFYMFSGPGTSAPSSTGYNSSTGNGSGYANGSVVGNHDFGNSGTFAIYGVAAGTTSHNGLSAAPTNNVDATKNVWEADGISGSSTASQSYVVQAFPTLPAANQNGTLQLSNFGHLTITVQPQSSQPIGLYINQPFVTMVIAGTVTQASTGTTITDANLALPTNAVGAGTAGGFGLANIANPQWSATGQSNTATTITMQNAITVANDDFYEVSIGDVSCGQGINNIGGGGSLPSGVTGPAPMVHGSPNTYAVALTSLDAPIDSVNVSNPIISTSEMFKISLAMSTPSANSNWYLWAVGFTP